MVVDVQGMDFDQYFDGCYWNQDKGDELHDSQMRWKVKVSPRPACWRRSHRRKGKWRRENEATCWESYE